MNTQQTHELIRRRPDAGLSLVSVMVALVLLSVGIMSVSQVLTQSVMMQTTLSLRTTGLDVARSYMEEVKGRDPLTLTAEDEVRVNVRGEEEDYGVFTRELRIETVDTHLMEVTVIVKLPRTNPIELVTWIYDGVY